MAIETGQEISRPLPPPLLQRGAVAWVRENLFSAWYNSAITIASLVLIGFALWFGLRWIIVQADWTVISVLGGKMVIGQYNTVAACTDQNCFWRPQSCLLLIMFLVGMGWGLTGGRLVKRIAIGVAVVLALFAFLPYSLDTMGMDVRLLLAANLPAVGLGWLIARYGPWGTPTRVVLFGSGAFLATMALMRGLESSDTDPVSALYWVAMAVLLGSFVLALGWGITGNRLIKRVTVGIAVVSVVVGVLPLGIPLGLDVRFLLVCNLVALGLGWAIARPPTVTAARLILWCIAIFVVALGLLRGQAGFPGLEPVSVIYWGGLTLNILLAVFGIVISLPIGIALALGRRSDLPVVRVLCVAFIEIFRGVPLITLLFMSQVLVPLAFPEDFPLNSLMRAAIIITLFSAAYMAENVRGGLQALHPGQAEAARALGLPSWETTILISLPQAIRNVIPAIVGQFISLFKDTSLVYIIGMLDVVEISRVFIQGNTEYIASAKELFIFLALVFWVFTYGMSYISRHIERNLGVGER